MTAVLSRLVIERRPDGRFQMTREMASANEPTADQWTCTDLLDAFDIVNNRFHPDGSIRPATNPPSGRRRKRT